VSPGRAAKKLFKKSLPGPIITPMITDELLTILCCPETQQPLTPVDPILITKVNGAIAKGTLRTRGGQKVTRPIDGGLVRDDRRYLYAVRQGIPVMLREESISLSNLESSGNRTRDTETPISYT